MTAFLRKWWLRFLLGCIGLSLAIAASGFLLRFEILRAYLDLPSFTHDGGTTRQVQVPMRDGVELFTQVFLPDGEGPWPVVLVRNPYDVANTFSVVCGVFVRFGYGCVHQDVRGRMRSAGEWEPMVNERNDGLDTLAWLVAQPFQDGNIALYGMSYLASVQWAVADALPPEVKTMIPMVYGTDGYISQYEGGLFRHEVISAWAALMPDDSMQFGNGDAYHALTRHRPAREADVAHLGVEIPWYRTWIDADTRSAAFWNRDDVRFISRQPTRAKVPVLALGGWFDLFLLPQMQDFARLRTRADSRFVIGPWHHLQRSDVDLPNDDGLGGQWAETMAWLDHHLRGAPYDRETGVVVTYAMGEGRWHTRPDWPPPTRQVDFHLGHLAQADSCLGGTLGSTQSGPEESVTYRYDPESPVPSRGGSSVLAFAFLSFDGVQPGPVEQGDLCARPDVLTFRSQPLTEAMHIAGRVKVKLRVSSDAPDTAFTVKLIEERPDGTAVNIREGARTLAYRDGDVERVRYTRGSAVGLTIELWPIEWRLAEGMRLRLEVSSSNFPALHAHPNRYGPWAEQTGSDVARNTVYGGAAATVSVPIWSEDNHAAR